MSDTRFDWGRGFTRRVGSALRARMAVHRRRVRLGDMTLDVVRLRRSGSRWVVFAGFGTEPALARTAALLQAARLSTLTVRLASRLQASGFRRQVR